MRRQAADPDVRRSGKLWNLQRIAGDGTKRFLRGGRTDGLFCLIGYLHATAARRAASARAMRPWRRSIAQRHPCIVAFSAKNMAAVARLWNAARPDLNFIICADDDSHLETQRRLRRPKPRRRDRREGRVPLGRRLERGA
jgi:phage/plasmid primase-like uncharacterized protein